MVLGTHLWEYPKEFRTGLFLCGGFQRGAGAPFCVVADEGVTGGKPHRKGFSLRACFWLLFARAKSNSGCGAESPIKFRKETCFVPTRPAMGESALHRPDALAQTDQNVPSARRAEAPYSPFPTLSSTECKTCATLWLSPGNSWANVSASTAGNFSRSSLSPRALA